MKLLTTITLSIYCFLNVGVFAQSSTLLPNAVELPKFTTNPACTAAEKGRLIYNTTDNKSYYCNGSAWVDMSTGGLTLPYAGSNNVTNPNNSFSVLNTSSGRAIYGETQSAIGLAGTGVYGNASSTNPSVLNTGVAGYNASTNAFGYGVYGYHDGSGTGVYGVVKGGGTAVKGFASNLFGGTGNGIGVEGISTTNTGVYGRSNSGVGVLGESTNNIGVFAKSTNDNAINAISTNRIGAYIESTNNSNGFAALYVQQYGTDKAAVFNGGDVSMSENLSVFGTTTVENGKGIVRSNNATQLKVVRISATLGGTNLASGSFLEGGTLNYEDFSAVPTVLVGHVNNSTATGDWHKVMVVPVNVSATQCQFRITNLSSSSATFNATWNILVIGAK